MSDVVAEKVREQRKARHWRVADLAARCKELDYGDLTENVIENIESGRRDADGKRRRAITVDELYALAKALDTAPMRLLIPQGTDAEWASAFGDIQGLAGELQRFVDGWKKLRSVNESLAVLEDPAVVEAIERAFRREGLS